MSVWLMIVWVGSYPGNVGESRDVAAEHPEIVARLRRIMQAEHVSSDLFPMPPIDR